MSIQIQGDSRLRYTRQNAGTSLRTPPCGGFNVTCALYIKAAGHKKVPKDTTILPGLHHCLIFIDQRRSTPTRKVSWFWYISLHKVVY